MKRLFSLFLILMALTACLPAYAQAADENLVYNGDFSLLDSSGMPRGWQKEMWHTDAGVSHLYLSEEGYEGNCIAVVNADANDARFVQTIDVERDSIYRFSCMVKAEDCGAEGYGATISFADCFSYSEEVLDTEGEWKRITVYGRTGKKQDEVTMMLRVGGYGSLGTGKAFFDNAEVYLVEKAPEGAEVLPLSTVDSSSNSSSAAAADDGAPARNTEAWLLMAVLYCLLVLAIARRSSRIRSAGFNAQAVLILGLSLAFVLRMFISVAVRGYNTDINCFSAWSERIFSNGPGSFYAPDYFCDYPPGYMLLLWPAAALRYVLGASYQGAAHLLLIKFLPIACDILGAVLVWRFAKKHRVHSNIALLLSLFYAFNPAAIIDSAAWGQIDSILALLIAICAIEAAEERYIPSLIAFAGAMLIKPQALLFAPLGLFAIIVYLIRSKSPKKLKEFAVGVLAALGLLYIFALLFNGFEGGVFGPVNWLVELYSSTLGSYSYITVNALNLYQLLDMNWVATDSVRAWVIFAWCMFAAAYLYSAFICAAAKKKQHILLAGGLLLSLIYCFGPKIHERYIFPAMLLLLLAYACDRDKRLLASLTVMTAVAAMNEILVLQGGMTEANYGHLQSSEQWLNALLSLVNCLNALYLCWVAADVCVQGHVCRLRRDKGTEFEADYPSAADGGAFPDKGRQELVPHAASSLDHRMHIRRVDCLLMAAVTLLYAFVALFNLGSTAAPQTSWVSSQAGESITFDLGKTETFRPIYYGGICNSNFTVELSVNGERWTEACHAKYNQGEIFRWIYFVPQDADGAKLKDADSSAGGAILRCSTSADPFPMQTARYFRITAKSAGLTLSEFGFWGEDGSLLPVSIANHSGAFDEFAADPALLIDEQDCVAEVPGWYNSTYFDEIYHARTAYELQNGMSIYEWTHPPLGKVTMMLGIELFGMTPFGWRFMGALMGILMVPLMYLLAKQLTKNTKLSFIAMCLMALDSMHFTQTRIATIDSYAVFWIMLEYLFMFRYFQMDWKQVKFAKTLIPLGLCGVTMGVAIATKWIGVYAAVGLALLFFWKLFNEGRRAEDRKLYWKRFVGTGCFCIAFFIIIPVLIYYFSHYLQLVHEGVSSFKDMFSMRWIERVIELQEQMLDYHAGLGGDTHYFRSPWYQWPVIWWPMWYYSGAEYVAGDMVSSISCMGNPAVWWSGLIALIAILVGAAWKRKTPKAWLLVLIGFASQFLPWVLVPRSTFIYHYFASVPFIILCTVLCLDWMKKHDRQTARWTSVLIVAAALILFIAFYPLESGVTVPRAYARFLRWFKWYNF